MVQQEDEAFEEAERALALLEGKDPEVVRKARLLRAKDEERAEQRRQSEEKAERQLGKAKARQGLVAAGLVACGGLAAWVVWSATASAELAGKLIAPQAAALESAGFRLERLGRPRKGKVEASAQLDGCVAAVGAEAGGPAPIELTVDGHAVRAEGVAVACGCGKLAVSASVQGKEGPAALGLYRAPASAVGGARRLGRALPGVARLDLGAECAEAELSAWLASKGRAAAKAAAQASGALADALALRGARVVGFSSGGDEVVPLALDADDCGLVLARRPSLRGHDGAAWAQGSEAGVAFCGADTAAAALREPGPLLAVAFKEADLDGVLGVVDAATAAGVRGVIATALGPRSAEASTRRLLERSAGQAAPARELAAAPEARLLAVARAKAERAPAGWPLLCDPPLDEAAAQALCVLPPGKELAGLGAGVTAFVAPMPPWLRVLERAADPAAQAKALAVLSLARRLRSEGFEPVTLESVRESTSAAEITGRSGEDRVVAVSLSPRPPYAIELSDGPRWSLDGLPRVLPLLPGQKLTLRDPRLAAARASERRTVVFRAAARQAP